MAFFRLLRAFFHMGILFLLPWLLGVAAGAVFDVREVKDSEAPFFFCFMMVALPLLLLQMLSIAIRVRRELRARRGMGAAGFSGFAVALERHARLLTGRGVGLVVGASIALMCALGLKWGQFAVMAVAGMGLLYLMVTAAAVASAFSILSFDERTARSRGRIERRMVPALAGVGEAVSEEFTLGRVPIPPLYRLHIAEPMPERIGGETRFVLDRNAISETVTVRAPLTQTVRGVYQFGPAEIAYEDLFGLTRIAVASLSTVDLRVLPQVRPIVYGSAPRALSEGDGMLARPHRFPAEDYFRIREYRRGDDARRIHWKRSIQLGAMHVRLPETVPHTPKDVWLVLDTFLPPTLRPAEAMLTDVLDLLVDGWVSLARTLSEKGERVVLAAVTVSEGKASVRTLQVRRGETVKVRSFGADLEWQSHMPPQALSAQLASAIAFDSGAAVWVSAALAPFPVDESVSKGAQRSLVWVDPRTIGAVPPQRSFFRRMLTYPFPAGAEDNSTHWRTLLLPKQSASWSAQMIAQHGAQGFAGVWGSRNSGLQLLQLRRAGVALSLGGL
jgi:uncharacterized protein (DUF58 family)